MMKCQLTAEGVLHIIAESEVEQFALSQWDRSKIEIDTKDYWACSIQSSKEFLQLIEGEKSAFNAFKRQRDNPPGSTPAPTLSDNLNPPP